MLKFIKDGKLIGEATGAYSIEFIEENEKNKEVSLYNVEHETEGLTPKKRG